MTRLYRRKRLHKYAACVSRYHKGIPSVKKLIKELVILASPVNHFRLELELGCSPCQEPTDTEICPVVSEQLPAINEFLHYLASEAREVTPGQLAIQAFSFDWRFEQNNWHTKLAATVLHSLLAKHRCIKSIHGLAVFIHMYPQLLFDGLRRSRSLTMLRFVRCWLLTGQTRSILNAVSSMPHFVELAFESCRITTGGWELIAEFLSGTTTLEALTMVGVSISGHSTFQVIEALELNTSISKLAVSSIFLTRGNGTAFRHFLVSTTTVTDLTVINDSTVATEEDRDEVFKAIVEGSMLQKLTMVSFSMDLISATQFTKAARLSVALQEVRFSDCHWYLPETECGSPTRKRDSRHLAAKIGSNWRVLPFVQALQKTSVLRKLSLNAVFSDDDCQLLLHAARDCPSLELLTLDKVRSQSMECFYQLLWETGTSEKVSLGDCKSVSAQFLPALSSCGALLHLGRHRLAFMDAPALREVSAALNLNDHITALDLRLVPEHDEFINHHDALDLARYLSMTTALKDFYLRLHVPVSVALVIIIEGLVKNRTIQQLDLEDMNICELGVECLCVWLAANKTTYHLGYHCGYFRVATQLLESLAHMLTRVPTLTSVRVQLFPPNFPHDQVVRHLVRRNWSRVECAAQFVLGSTSKRAAEAFEQVSWHPQLPSRVEKAGSLTPTQVAQKLEESGKRLQKDFFKLVGVVRDKLVCHPSSNGAKQMSDLGPRELQCIYSNLSVCDVVTSQPREPDGPVTKEEWLILTKGQRVRPVRRQRARRQETSEENRSTPTEGQETENQ
ncbi:uncharacterized protein LOC144179209 [Haemaphysalis longicornis]